MIINGREICKRRQRYEPQEKEAIYNAVKYIRKEVSGIRINMIGGHVGLEEEDASSPDDAEKKTQVSINNRKLGGTGLESRGLLCTLQD